MPDGTRDITNHASTPTSDVPQPVIENALVIHLFLGREAGGITSAMGQWIPAQMEAGWRHLAFCLRPGAVEREMERFAVPAVVADNGRGYSTPKRFFHKLRTELRSLGPAIIHAHNPAAQFYAAWQQPRHAEHRWRVVRTVHADSRLEMKHNLSLPGRLFWNTASAWSMAHTDGLICIHEHVRQCLPTKYQQQAVVMPNGLNAAEIENSTKPLPTDLADWLGSDDIPMVLSIGRLVDIKRFDWVIDCWAKTKTARNHARLVILGEGTQRAALQQQIESLGLQDCVRLQHWTADIAPILKRSCLTVVASKSETGPLVLLESMAAGAASIATPVGIVPDVIEEGVTGWMIDHPDDANRAADSECQQLASLLDRLLSEPATLEEAGRCARRRLAETHSHTAAAARRAEFYNRVLQPTGKPD
ncbi:MAG: glycosyltransferase family 1 protein [Planctomycetes bacterium]|nr:glycosyltransferase family 1 protein [Planctomycetota bacterium]NOG54650.1 glycosyltransferase family 4 protein [Planctomycetota bacterium]